MNKIAVGLAAALFPVSGQAASFNRVEQWQAIHVPVVNAANTIANFTPPTDGRAAAEIEDTLSALGDSAQALQDEIGALGTSASEQEVQAFGDNPSSGAGADLSFGLLNGLMSGHHYDLTFSYLEGLLPTPRGETRDFTLDVPIRVLGDPSTQRLITARFTAPVSRSPYQFFLIKRPVEAGSDFGLSQIYLVDRGVPEPRSWALLLSGFAMLGVALRRRTAMPQRVEEGLG